MKFLWTQIQAHKASRYIPENGVFWDEHQKLWEVRVHGESVTWHRGRELALKYFRIFIAQKGLRRDISRSAD